MRFLSPNEIADALAMSPKTVRRWIDKGILPAHRLGRLLRVSEADFEAFLDHHLHRPKPIRPTTTNQALSDRRDSVAST